MGAVRSHTVGLHSSRGSHHITSHTYTCRHTHINLFFCTMMSSLLCGAVRDNHILNTPNWSILNINYLAYSSFSKTVQLSQCSSVSSLIPCQPLNTYMSVSMVSNQFNILMFTQREFGHRLLLIYKVHCWRILYFIINSILWKLWWKKKSCFSLTW